MPNFVELDRAIFSSLAYSCDMGLNAFLIFMSSYKGLGPKKQFWPIRMKLSKPFHRQLFHYTENLLYELFSNIHRINCPTPVSRTKIRPLTCCVISLAQYIYNHVLIIVGFVLFELLCLYLVMIDIESKVCS